MIRFFDLWIKSGIYAYRAQKGYFVGFRADSCKLLGFGKLWALIAQMSQIALQLAVLNHHVAMASHLSIKLSVIKEEMF